MHDGRTNYYSFKCNNKTCVLRPMIPSQVVADNAKTIAGKQQEQASSEKSGEREIHPKASERNKPNMSRKIKSATNGVILLATKSEMREVRENPSIFQFVLVCKGKVLETNNLTNLPS